MAWEIAVILGIVSLASIFLILTKNFDTKRQGMKVLFTMITLASLVLLSQIIKLIITNQASSSTITNLTSMANTSLVITIAIFSFFSMYFLVTYTVGIINGVKDAKEQKKEFDWNY